MQMCEEMKKLRAELDRRGIPWEDKSTITDEKTINYLVSKGCEKSYCDCTMYTVILFQKNVIGDYQKHKVCKECYDYVSSIMTDNIQADVVR